MRGVLLIIAGVVLLGFIGVTVIWPQMSDGDAPGAAQALVSGAEELKSQVAAAAEKAGDVRESGKGVRGMTRADPKFGELRWLVAEAGTVRAWAPKHAIEIALVPSVQGGKIAWTCRGYPAAAMPAACRPR